MRRWLCLLLCLLLTGLCLAGCEDDNTEPTTAPTEAEIHSTSAPSEAPTVPETEETYPQAQVNTVVLRDRDAGLRQDFLILAISQDAPFLAQDVKLNRRGANALAQWLISEDGRELAGEFGQDTYGQSVYSLPEDDLCYTGYISKATAATATIRLAVEESLVSSGLTEALLPVFEDTYGYTVEIRSGNARATSSAARNGYADLVLTVADDSVADLAAEGFLCTVEGLEERETIPFLSMPYLLCGPKDDPAGAKTAANSEAAFAAIAKHRSAFVSPGKGSFARTLEQQLWPKNTDFDGWYVQTDMEMGPCLVMNDIQGGYILTDNLTWLIFTDAKGII